MEKATILSGLANVILNMSGLTQLKENEKNPYLPKLELLGDSLLHKYVDKPEKLKDLLDEFDSKKCKDKTLIDQFYTVLPDFMIKNGNFLHKNFNLVNPLL